MDSEEYVRDDAALLSLQPWIFRKEVDEDEQKRRELSLRSRRHRKYDVRPRASPESCAIPQLYNGFRVEEYALSSIPSPAAAPARALRPLLITDGERMSGKSSYGRFTDALKSEEVRGLPSVPQLVGSTRRRRGKMQNGGVCISSSVQRGLLDRVFLFCLGICIGVMSTIFSNRREVEKLNDILRHTNNLVQDLQEDLSMRDSLMVTELAHESCDKQELIDCPMDIDNCINSSKNQTPMSMGPALDTVAYDQSHLFSAGEISESRSKMEAELQAELEILEQSLSTSSLEQRMSSYSELDPDLIDVAHGELRADVLDPESRKLQADIVGDTNSTSTMTTHDVNYAVSPRELSLRLHEVVNSRLEERVKELEKALQHSQRQLRLMEAAGSQAFSISDMGSYSNHESPRGMESQSATIHPSCLNNSGDALNAYDEGYEVFMITTEEEDDKPSSFHTEIAEKIGGEEVLASDPNMIWDFKDSKVNKLTNNKFKNVENGAAWEQVLKSGISGDVSDSDGDIEDEEGKLLIQQILEKTRQGSPVLINAQMMLFSME